MAALAASFAGCTDDEGEATDQETPAPDPTDETTTTTTEATTEETTTVAETTQEQTATQTPRPDEIVFDVEIDEINDCGSTCSTLVFTTYNEGAVDAPGVVIDAVTYTDGEQIYEDQYEAGDIAGGSSVTLTRDQDVGQSNAMKVAANDGDVTIELTPSSGDVSEMFTFERNVS
jgi:hypothetical protein